MSKKTKQLNQEENVTSAYSYSSSWDDVSALHLWWKHFGGEAVIPSVINGQLDIESLKHLLNSDYEILSVQASYPSQLDYAQIFPHSKDEFCKFVDKIKEEKEATLKPKNSTKDLLDDDDEDDSLDYFFGNQLVSKESEFSLILINKEKQIVIKIAIVFSKKSLHFTAAGTDRKTVTEETNALIAKYRVIPMKKSSRFFIVLEQRGQPVLKEARLKPMDIDVETYYGEGFSKIHGKIVDSLSNRTDGIYMFHGPPGTGKTSYIKLLAQELYRAGREFIFIPTAMIGSLADPRLLNLLVGVPNSVLVLEDAEKAVMSRDDNNNSHVVSALLNLADGILGSILNIAVIVTFNTERNKIDKALLRKGRLAQEHEFRLLSVGEAHKVAEKLKVPEFKSESPVPLSDIFNYAYDTGHREEEKKNRVIGFGAP